MRFPAPLNLLPPFAITRACRTVGVAVLIAGTFVEAGDLSSITQREIQRREHLISNAESQLGEGQLLLDKGQPEEATRAFLAAYDSLPKSPLAEATRSRLRAAYGESACAWARKLLSEGRYEEANKVIDGVLDQDMDPGNKQAITLRKEAADPDRYPPALTPKHIAATKEVIRLLTLAGSATDLGDYNKARDLYSQTLRIDAYNTAARRGLEHIEKIRSHYFNSARDHTRAKQLGQVDASWEEAVPPSDKTTAFLATSNGGGGVLQTGREKVEKRLRELKVAHVEFNNAGLDEVMEYMRVTSRNVDPEGRGVDFIVNLDAEARGRQLSINMNNVPLEDLLHYVTQIAGVTYRIEANAVVIVSLTERSTALITKSYKVPPDFIQTAAVDTAAAPAAADPFAKAPAGGVPAGLQIRRMGAKEFLEGRGVVFPEGGSASFSGGNSTLIVRGTAENISFVDTLVEQSLANGTKQAVISVKMIDISQSSLNELGFDWELGQFNLPGSKKVFAGGGGGNSTTAAAYQGAFASTNLDPSSSLMTGGLRSSGEILGQPSIEGLISSSANSNSSSSSSSTASTVPSVTARTPAAFGLLGVNTDPQFQMALRALSQSKGVDLVTAPMITVKSGQKSSVRVVREFPYPTQFNPPQIPQTVGLSGGAPITPTTPTAFATRELGTILEVEPVISGDGHTVEISLTPSDVEFEGFIDYGTPIVSTNPSSAASAITTALSTGVQPETTTSQPNHIYQPVFRNTHVTTAVNVYDGSTVVLGGLVTDNRTDINDKVPLIGDIPLIGRFWQSKVSQSQKRCILFFVTVKVIDPSGQRISQVTAAP